MGGVARRRRGPRLVDFGQRLGLRDGRLGHTIISRRRRRLRLRLWRERVGVVGEGEAPGGRPASAAPHNGSGHGASSDHRSVMGRPPQGLLVVGEGEEKAMS